MIEIRPFTEEFAAGAASLHFRAMRGQSKDPGVALPKYFCEVLLGNPWATPEIPPLVCLEEGKVIGSLGVIPRPMEFRGQNIVAATLTQFMVDPDYRRGPAAVQLLRRCLQGPQDMTWADGSGDPVHLFHKAFGSLAAYSLHWMRFLRPFESGRDFLSRLGGKGKVLQRLAALGTIPADFMVTRLPMFRVRRPAQQLDGRSVAILRIDHVYRHGRDQDGPPAKLHGSGQDAQGPDYLAFLEVDEGGHFPRRPRIRKVKFGEILRKTFARRPVLPAYGTQIHAPTPSACSSVKL